MAVGDILKLVDSNDYQRVFVNISDYISLNACVQAVSGSNQTILISSSTVLTSNLVVPASIEIIVTKSGLIVQSGYNLTINGQFTCGKYQAFSGGNVYFSSSVIEVYAIWFGMVANDSGTDNAVPINKAINSKIAVGTYEPIKVVLPVGIYYIKSPIVLTSSLHLEGSGVGYGHSDSSAKGTTLKGYNYTGSVLIDGQNDVSPGYIFDLKISSLNIEGDPNISGITLMRTGEICNIIDVQIYKCKYGIYMGKNVGGTFGSYAQVTPTITNISISNSYTSAVYFGYCTGGTLINTISGDNNKAFITLYHCDKNFNVSIGYIKMEVYDVVSHDSDTLMIPAIDFTDSESILSILGGYVGARQVSGADRDHMIRITKSVSGIRTPIINILGLGITGYGNIIYDVPKNIKLTTWDNSPQYATSFGTPSLVTITPIYYGGVLGTYGGLKNRVVSVSSNYRALCEDYFINVDTTSGNLTITLPDPLGMQGQIYKVRKTSSDANTITLITDNAPSRTIGYDSTTSHIIYAYGETVEFVSVNSSWKICSNSSSYRINSGSPSGSLVPLYRGEDLFDSTNNDWWKSYGLTNTSWKKTT